MHYLEKTPKKERRYRCLIETASGGLEEIKTNNGDIGRALATPPAPQTRYKILKKVKA
jgi:hypothetical protein